MKEHTHDEEWGHAWMPQSWWMDIGRLYVCITTVRYQDAMHNHTSLSENLTLQLRSINGLAFCTTIIYYSGIDAVYY
jgi:hypothetical protein